jgi:hypothetical protein
MPTDALGMKLFKQPHDIYDKKCSLFSIDVSLITKWCSLKKSREDKPDDTSLKVDLPIDTVIQLLTPVKYREASPLD